MFCFKIRNRLATMSLGELAVHSPSEELGQASGGGGAGQHGLGQSGVLGQSLPEGVPQGSTSMGEAGCKPSSPHKDCELSLGTASTTPRPKSGLPNSPSFPPACPTHRPVASLPAAQIKPVGQAPAAGPDPPLLV